jgi:20S proteasome subunit beta 2
MRATVILLAFMANYDETSALPAGINELEWSCFNPCRYDKDVSVPEEKRYSSTCIDFSSSLIRESGNFEVNGNVDTSHGTHFSNEEYNTLALGFDPEYGYDAISSYLSTSLRRKRHFSSPTTAQPTMTTTSSASTVPKVRHTGTTIAGCIAENGEFVIIGADSRATEETIVADKECEKVHKLSENVWCCGAGTSADNDALMRQIRFSLLLDGMIKSNIGNRKVPSSNPYHEKRGIAEVSAVCRRIRNLIYQAKGNLGVNLVLGGFDFCSDQAILAAIHPHGSMDIVPFTALGSGGLAAMSILEATHRLDMSLEEAIELVKAAIASGISNDLGSGSQIDICIIGRDCARYHRAYVKEEDLPVTEFDKANAAMLHSRHRSGEEDQRGGVGGFGSLPFSIKSKRLVMKSDAATDQSRREWLEKTLDLM